jgi:hypothetical protein
MQFWIILSGELISTKVVVTRSEPLKYIERDNSILYLH